MRISVTFLVVGSLFRSVLSSEGNGVATSSHATATAECKDLDDTIQCREWAWHGECDKNKEYMHDKCQKSCGVCTPSTELAAQEDTCVNAFYSCKEWADHGKCHGLWTSTKGSFEINAAYIIEFCPKACNVCDIYLDDRDMALNLGLPQDAPGMYTDKHLFHHVRAKVEEVRKYVNSIEDKKLKEACKMSHPNCARFALATDCDDHAEHEIIKYGCAAACMTCDKLVKNDGIAKAELFWSKALKEYEEKKQQSFTMKKA